MVYKPRIWIFDQPRIWIYNQPRIWFTNPEYGLPTHNMVYQSWIWIYDQPRISIYDQPRTWFTNPEYGLPTHNMVYQPIIWFTNPEYGFMTNPEHGFMTNPVSFFFQFLYLVSAKHKKLSFNFQSRPNLPFQPRQCSPPNLEFAFLPRIFFHFIFFFNLFKSISQFLNTIWWTISLRSW